MTGDIRTAIPIAAKITFRFVLIVDLPFFASCSYRIRPAGSRSAIGAICYSRDVGLLRRAPRFEQEPSALFGFVDPIFQQACGSDVAAFVAEAVCLAHVGDQPLVDFTQFGQHVTTA
jgi:hypothetical protein